jgi:hypothetical protein
MYPHVDQFDTQSQPYKLQTQLIRYRTQARARKTIDRPSLLTRIGSALTDRGLRGLTEPSPR